MHTTDFLFISLTFMSFMSVIYSHCLVCFSHFISSPAVSLCFFLGLFQTFFLSFSLPLTHTQRRRLLFLAGWVWKSAMINMLPWLLILSNGSVKLQCRDKYRTWRNICSTTQRHDEEKQLEFIGYICMTPYVVFGHRSKASSILQLPVHAGKSQNLN